MPRRARPNARPTTCSAKALARASNGPLLISVKLGSPAKADQSGIDDVNKQEQQLSDQQQQIEQQEVAQGASQQQAQQDAQKQTSKQSQEPGRRRRSRPSHRPPIRA